MKKLVLTAALLLLGACGGQKSATTAEPAQAAQGGEAEHTCGKCPMKMEGATVAYADAPDGAAIVFTTESGDVAELQAQVASKAEHHNSPEPKPAKAHIPHSARAENEEHGARLVMVPTDPKDLEALRAHVREHVASMQAGKCPMMGGEGHGGHGHGGHGPSE